MTQDDLSNLSFLHIILSTNRRITLRSPTENQRSDKEGYADKRTPCLDTLLVSGRHGVRFSYYHSSRYPCRYPHIHRTVPESRLFGMLITHATIRIMSCSANVSQASQRSATKLVSERRFLQPPSHRSYTHLWQENAWRRNFSCLSYFEIFRRPTRLATTLLLALLCRCCANFPFSQLLSNSFYRCIESRRPLDSFVSHAGPLSDRHFRWIKAIARVVFQASSSAW